MAAALLAAKLINIALERYIQKRRPDEGQDDPVSGDLILSTVILIKTVVFYSAIVAAAVIVLKIFNINIVSPEDLKKLGLIFLKTVAIIVAARLALKLGRAAITQIFSKKFMKDGLIDNRRVQTLASLAKNMITYLVFFLAGLMILQVFNVNTSAILASAGILGLAVGFGAQNLVKDIISGFFILFEDQFSVGDYVTAAGVEGVVEETGLRTCKIRSWTGQLHIIPNGELKLVTNFSRGYMMAVATVGIAYEEDIDRAIEVLKKECENAREELPALLEVPVVQGVTALGDFSVNIRTIVKTVPGEQWAVERELRRRFKNALDREGIEIPYPRRVIQYREEANKEIQPLRQPEA